MVALANITSQKKPVVDSLYRHNGIKRIVNALQRPDCKTVFVLEQVIIFSLAYACECEYTRERPNTHKKKMLYSK